MSSSVAAAKLVLPFALAGSVVHGFGRGGSQLGFPTANIDLSDALIASLQPYSNWVLCGWGSIDTTPLASSPTSDHFAARPPPPPASNGDESSEAVPPPPPPPFNQNATQKTLCSDLQPAEDGKVKVYPFAMSIGFNPQFKNKALTAEVYFMHNFKQDFYGATVRIVVVAGIRQQSAFTTLDALIETIQGDVRNTHRLLGISTDAEGKPVAPGTPNPEEQAPLGVEEMHQKQNSLFLQPDVTELPSKPFYSAELH